MRRQARWLLGALLALAWPRAVAAQDLAWESLSMAGILRASGKVDSVFIDRLVPEQVVGGGDWVSYLAARLGALPIPDSNGIVVAVDTNHILVRGRMVDLPPETRALFGPVVMFADSTTTLEAEVVMGPTGPGVVKFVLTTVRVNGFPIPESILQIFLARVGRQYPMLTETGRVLLVAVPPDGKVGFRRNGVRLWIEAGGGTPPPSRPSLHHESLTRSRLAIAGI
jgi:hypothetical protein